MAVVRMAVSRVYRKTDTQQTRKAIALAAEHLISIVLVVE